VFNDWGGTRPEDRYAKLKWNYPDLRLATALVAENAALGNFLRTGLATLKKSGIDLDSLSFEMATAQ